MPYLLDRDIYNRCCDTVSNMFTQQVDRLYRDNGRPTLEYTQCLLILGEVPQAANIATPLKAGDIKPFFQQVLDTHNAHGP